jgi:uncharacterized OB-fold protein
VSELLAPQEPGIPIPRPGLFSAPYWEAARQGRLVYQRCDQCGHVPRLPAKACGACHAGGLAWVESAGTGELYSWTVVWRPQHPAFRIPYAPAIMRVDEGWWLLTAVVGCAIEDLREGMPLRVEFHAAGGDIWLPYARPEGRAG